MTRRWTLLAGTVLLAAASALGACGSDDDDGGGNGDEFTDEPTEIAGIATPEAFPIQVQRSDGQALTIEAPPQRIVSLSPGATEIIYALGAEAALVAVDQQADYPEAAANFETKLDAYQPNVEAIAGLTPDLVIVADDTGGLVEALDRLQIPVLYIDLDTNVSTIEEVLGQIRLYGQITGKDAGALTLIDDLSARVRAITERTEAVPAARGPKVYHELDSTYYSIADSTFIGDLYRKLRARNIAGDGGGVSYPQLTQEKIIADNPDVIILADEEFGVTVESVKARPGWNAITAVAEDRIYGIDPDIISRPGPRIVDALEELARNIYPSEFE